MMPLSQAVYRDRTSTTEHVSVMTILCEDVITSCDYSTHILLLDMTKAFDTINCEHLCRLLSEFLDLVELSIMNILPNDVTLRVNNKTKGQTFTTTLGIPRRECLSAILFTLYLSNALSQKISTHLHNLNYYNAQDMFLTPIERLLDHIYCTKHGKNSIPDYIIDQQYADDIGFISNNENTINKVIKNIALLLKE